MLAADIVEKIGRVSNTSELHSVVDAFAHEVGMDGAYIINFHPTAGLTSVDKRPTEWMEYYGKEGYIHFDPIAHRAFAGGSSFTWEDCIERSHLSKDQKNLMAQARDFGLKQGYNTVANNRDYSAATCCFYNKDFRDFRQSLRSNKRILDAVGHAAQDKLAALVTETISIPSLSPREIQCLTEAARGATNEVIGSLYGISKNTVETHIKSACRKLGVRTKIQATSLAIQLKLIFPIKFSTMS